MQAQAPAPSPAPELPEIRDIASPVDVFPWPLWQVALVILAAAAVLGVLAWLVVRLLRKPAPPPPPLSARAKALRDLEALRSRKGGLDAQAFSVVVSDVLRTFIGAHFGLRTTTQTSPEFLASIADSPTFSAEDRGLLETFLEKCDFIKYAHASADEESLERLLESAFGFVQGSRA